MAKMQSIVGEPGQVQIERVPMLQKPIAHADACTYVEHQLVCTAQSPEGYCACEGECSCGAMTEQDIHNWLDLLRPSRVAIAAAAAVSRSKRTQQSKWDEEF